MNTWTVGRRSHECWRTYSSILLVLLFYSERQKTPGDIDVFDANNYFLSWTNTSKTSKLHRYVAINILMWINRHYGHQERCRTVEWSAKKHARSTTTNLWTASESNGWYVITVTWSFASDYCTDMLVLLRYFFLELWANTHQTDDVTL